MKPQLSKIFIFLVPGVLLFTLRPVQAQYCVDSLYTSGCNYGDYIDNVSISTVNQTGTGCGINGYSDYTNLTADFAQGSLYQLTVTVGGYQDYLSIWVDFNDDFIFDNSEKLLFGFLCSSPNTNYSVNFGMPFSAPLGNHRMRLRCEPDTWYFDACSQDSLGEVHDYTANVLPQANMSYVSSTTTQIDTGLVSLGSTNNGMIGIQVLTSGTLNPIAVTSMTLNSNGSTDFFSDVTNVVVYYSGSYPFFSAGGFPFGSATDLSSPITGADTLLQGMNYFWVTFDIGPNAVINDYVDAECTSLIVGGTSYTPTITAPPGNRQIDPYIPPVDVYGCYTAYIDAVELNTLSHYFSYCNGNVNGYINYPQSGNLTTTLQQGSSYPIALTGPLGNTLVGFGVWLDFNSDGDFDDIDEFVFSSPTIDSGLQTGYITIPSSAAPGDHRLRVRSNGYDTLSSTNSCTQFNYGETEDYTITIIQQLCSANFTLYPDSLIPHHYWAVNLAWGVPPLNYLWSWGDGNYDSIAYPSHTYAAAGFYTICLTIQDSAGCSGTYCTTYNIQKMSSAEAENTIIKIDVVDSLPNIPTTLQNSNIQQSWSVFPNPVSTNIFVNYSLSIPATVSIEIDDVLGNKLQQIANDQPAGESLSIFDVRALPNGIYLLKICAGDKMASQKMVMMK